MPHDQLFSPLLRDDKTCSGVRLAWRKWDRWSECMVAECVYSNPVPSQTLFRLLFKSNFRLSNELMELSRSLYPPPSNCWTFPTSFDSIKHLKSQWEFIRESESGSCSAWLTGGGGEIAHLPRSSMHASSEWRRRRRGDGNRGGTHTYTVVCLVVEIRNKCTEFIWSWSPR